MDNRQKNTGDAKRRYGEERHVIGASQGGVSENMENLHRQGSNVKNTGQNELVGCKPWRKMAACAKIIKEKIEENQKTVKKGQQRQMIMDGGEVIRLKKCGVVKSIENQKQLRECEEIKKLKKVLTYV